jgi:uncharacterized membrane protein (UPF0127 family)
MPPRLRRLPSLPLGGEGARIVVAAGLRARLCGLAGLRAPPPRVALLLAPCRSVHTFGMRWPLDLVWLGPAGEVVRVDRDVGPRRVLACRRATGVIEAPAGHGAPLAGELQH